MNAAATVVALPAGAAQCEGVTYAQAMEVFARFFERDQAVPTIAHQMGLEFEAACRVLGGHIWPAAYRYWLDKVLP